MRSAESVVRLAPLVSAASREWCAEAPASAAELEALRRATPVALPSGFYQLLARSNGGEGPLAIWPFHLVLDPAEVTAAALVRRPYGPGYAHLAVFGGDGEEHLFAFDLRDGSPLAVVAVAMCAGPGSATLVARDFAEFIVAAGIRPGTDERRAVSHLVPHRACG